MIFMLNTWTFFMRPLLIWFSAEFVIPFCLQCLSVIPSQIVRWVIAGVAGFMSATFVALNLRSHIKSAGERWFLIVVGIFLLQLALALVLKLYLFTVTVWSSLTTISVHSFHLKLEWKCSQNLSHLFIFDNAKSCTYTRGLSLCYTPFSSEVFGKYCKVLQRSECIWKLSTSIYFPLKLMEILWLLGYRRLLWCKRLAESN